MADLAFLAMTGKKPTEAEARPLQILVGLLISNGPGSISAQGAKGAVSADGPQTPGRVQINKAMVGFLTHTRLQPRRQRLRGHGLPARPVQGQGPKRPDRSRPTASTSKAMATEFAKAYGARRRRRRSAAPSCRARCLACITRSSRASPSTTTRASGSSPSTWQSAATTTSSTTSTASSCRRSTTQGASPYVFCVNVDAVIAALLLALLWKDYKSRRAQRARSRDGGLHGVPLRPDDRLRRRRSTTT